jgi:hypothetical protein
MKGTATPTPVTHIYKEINVGKYRTVKHYQLQKLKNGEPQLENIVQLANNRAFAKSKPFYWFTQRNGGKWQKPFITGLFETIIPGIYNGDVNHKNNLLIFQVDEVAETLTIYYYVGFFTYNLDPILKQFTN